VYVGFSNWFGLQTVRGDGTSQENNWVPIIQLGNTFVRKKWHYTIEVKYIAPNYSNQDLVVTYNGIGNNGASGLYFGVTRFF
jgi:hypothetical protein